MTSQVETTGSNTELDRLIPHNDDNDEFPPEPENYGQMPVFGALTLLFNALQAERKQDIRRRIVEKWFHLWRQRVGPNLYPALRLILPQKDRERAIYHCKEANIAKALIAVMGIEKAPDAAQLLNWKRPTGYQHKKSVVGDFPGLVYEVISKRSSVIEGTLRIDRLNELLDDLSKHGSKLEHQKRVFSQLFLKCTAEEIRWIIKIILKDLNAGVKESTVFGVFHPDATAVFNSCSDLKRVAYQLWDPSHQLADNDKSVQMFRCFAPMLSKRPPKNLTEAVKRFGGVPFKVEEKLDGERIQLHKRGSSYFYCSRKSKEYTYLYGKHPGEGSLTPYIHASFNPEVEECILDGEMLVWDPVSERYLPFGTLKTHAGDKFMKREYTPRPCFKVFDVLYLNGKSLTGYSLMQRRRNLERVFDPVEGRLEIMHQFEATTVGDVQNLLRKVVEDRGEGLILKHPNSTYVLNGRVDQWVKVKPEYMEGQGETFDLLVVGGNFGKGSRGGGVSTLIVAVKDDRPGAAGNGELWTSFARIGTGFSFADYVNIRSKSWVEWGEKGPSFLQTAPRSIEDKGDVYLSPEDSFVVTVKGAEITVTDCYHLKLTLRFPRALRIREEYTANDAMTATEILEQFASGRKRKHEQEELDSNKRKRTGGKKAIVSNSFQVSKGIATAQASGMFSRKKFLILAATQADVPYKREELVKLVKSNGGSLVATKSGNPDIIVFGGRNTPPDVKSIIKEDTNDIVYPQWVIDCVKRNKLLPIRTKYLRHKSSSHGSDTDDQDSEEEGPHSGTLDVENDQDEHVDTLSTINQEATQTQTLEDLESRPHSDWIKLEPEDTINLGRQTLELSDDDLTDHEEPDEEEDDWVNILSERGPQHSDEGPSMNRPRDFTTMGEDDEAMELDQEMFFRHSVFYLDSPSNARKNRMLVKTSKEVNLEKRFEEIAKLVTKYGGRVTSDIQDPKLTHVILDNDDLSRRKTIFGLTSKGKFRRLVISEYINACVQERTMINEEGEWIVRSFLSWLNEIIDFIA
ncbi:DNA ligase (ATP) [Serendipita sp. 397]|nr:DNA ligase (ATP) [Serendipita sp. 397]